MKKKKVLKRGERIVWMLWGETTKPVSMGSVDALRHDVRLFNTKNEAEAALAKYRAGKGLLMPQHTHSGVRQGTFRRLRGTTAPEQASYKHQPKMSKLQKLVYSAEQVDARRKKEKEGIYCSLCGNKITKGTVAHIINGKYYHAINCTHGEKRV